MHLFAEPTTPKKIPYRTVHAFTATSLLHRLSAGCAPQRAQGLRVLVTPPLLIIAGVKLARVMNPWRPQRRVDQSAISIPA